MLWDGSIAENPPCADFEEADADPSARHRMLQAVCDYGFCKIAQLPTGEGQASRLIELVGTQRQTHYGTYTLSRKGRVNNVGDVHSALDPHTDEAYRLSGIGVTVFQVLRPSSSGGDSTLVDGFEAARRLRERWPEDFELLTRVPIPCHRLDPDHTCRGLPRWYVSRLPAIKLDSDGEISGIHLNERQIAPLDLPAAMIGPCYRALRRLLGIVYDPALLATFKLGAGEGLVFHNQRVLHGRTEFTPEEPGRSVLTSSVDLEEFHSALRTLETSLATDSPPMAYSQGMAV